MSRSPAREEILFPSSGSASGSHSQMGFMVTDITAEVRDLRQRGVLILFPNSPPQS
jgi:hypothetical protein